MAKAGQIFAKARRLRFAPYDAATAAMRRRGCTRIPDGGRSADFFGVVGITATSPTSLNDGALEQIELVSMSL